MAINPQQITSSINNMNSINRKSDTLRYPYYKTVGRKTPLSINIKSNSEYIQLPRDHDPNIHVNDKSDQTSDIDFTQSYDLNATSVQKFPSMDYPNRSQSSLTQVTRDLDMDDVEDLDSEHDYQLPSTQNFAHEVINQAFRVPSEKGPESSRRDSNRSKNSNSKRNSNLSVKSPSQPSLRLLSNKKHDTLADHGIFRQRLKDSHDFNYREREIETQKPDDLASNCSQKYTTFSHNISLLKISQEIKELGEMLMYEKNKKCNCATKVTEKIERLNLRNHILLSEFCRDLKSEVTSAVEYNVGKEMIDGFEKFEEKFFRDQATHFQTNHPFDYDGKNYHEDWQKALSDLEFTEEKLAKTTMLLKIAQNQKSEAEKLEEIKANHNAEKSRYLATLHDKDYQIKKLNDEMEDLKAKNNLITSMNFADFRRGGKIENDDFDSSNFENPTDLRLIFRKTVKNVMRSKKSSRSSSSVGSKLKFTVDSNTSDASSELLLEAQNQIQNSLTDEGSYSKVAVTLKNIFDQKFHNLVWHCIISQRMGWSIDKMKGAYVFGRVKVDGEESNEMDPVIIFVLLWATKKRSTIGNSTPNDDFEGMRI